MTMQTSTRQPDHNDDKVTKLVEDVAAVKTDVRWQKWLMFVILGLHAPSLFSAPAPAVLLANLVF